MSEKILNIDAKKLAQLCAQNAADKKAADIVTLKVSELTTIADYFVLCTAASDPQMRAIVSFVERQAREHMQVRPLSVNGESGSGWILVDFGMVLFHIMTPETRERSQLEELWSEAPREEFVEKINAFKNANA
ncbi:MAG: ribosome silencing factor [Victivallaceae bacterium]